MTKEYRPDIDGLRALAVTSVLGFHAFPAVFKGGFTGVDIFFVISGYLISGIILRELREGSFSFARFFARRIRRIFPALALVLAAVLIFGWWSLTPYDYDQLGAHAAAGAGFVSNVLLWRESGYFDTDSALKPLLHLWSLGVEEQYYLIWPLLLFILRKRMDRIFWLILAAAVGSFAINILLVDRMSWATFYLPVTRFWELMLGGLLAYLHLLRPRYAATAQMGELLAISGLMLLIAALALVSNGEGYPGWRALLPTVGTVLLIQAGPQAWLNRHVLANRGVVYIGLISYPLYLWHWPILSFARVIHGGLPPPQVRIEALIVSIVLAWATYEFIERPVRHMARGPAARMAVAIPASCVAALGCCGLLVAGNYAQARSSSIPRLAQISAAYSDWHVRAEGKFPGDTPSAVLFFGDSHMQQFLPRIRSLTQNKLLARRTVIFMTRGGCAPFPGIDRPGYGCAKFVADAFAMARDPMVHTVVISASWVGFVGRDDYYVAGLRGKPLKMLTPATQWVFDGFEAEIRSLTAAGKEVVILLSSPFGDAFDPVEMVRRSGLSFQVNPSPADVPRSEIYSESRFVDEQIRQIALRTHATVLDPLETICSAEKCPVFDSNGDPIMRDSSHLRSSWVQRHFEALDRYVLYSSTPVRCLGVAAQQGTAHEHCDRVPADGPPAAEDQ